MPAFLKTPKFIGSAIIVLWVVYVIWANVHLELEIHLIPFLATLDLSVPTLLIAAALFGAIATLVIQWLWRRRSSKNAAASPTPGASARTVA